MGKNNKPLASNDTGRWYALVCLALAGVFIGELLTPLGFAHGTLYVPIVLLSALSRDRRFLLATAVGACFLTLLGIIISPTIDVPSPIYLTNRLFSIISILVTAIVALFALRAFMEGGYIRKQLTDSLDDLQQKQVLLNIAGQIGHIGGWMVRLPRQEGESIDLIWSDEVCRIHAVPPGFKPTLKEGVGFYAPEFQHTVEEAFQACVELGRPFDLELQIINMAGEKIWVRAIARPVADAKGRVLEVHGALQDLSREKQQELVLQESRQRFHQLADAMPLFVFTATAKGHLDYVNRSVNEYTGEDDEALLTGQSWLKFLHPSDRRMFLERWQRAVDESREMEVEFRFRDHQGHYRWHLGRATPIRDRQGNVAHWYGTAIDIHELKHMEETTRHSEERFRYISMATTDAVWDWDVVAGTLWWNDQYYKLFGFDKQSESANPEFWSAHVHPEDREEVVRSMRAAPRGRESEWRRQYRFLRKDGSVAHVDDRGYLIRDENGKGIRMVGGMSDITEEKSLQKRLQQSDRLRAVGELTGGVAHDFNNLLAVIMGNTELLAEQLTDTPQLRQLVQTTHEAAEKGSQLTGRLLAFARRQALEPRSLDLRELLNGMESLLRRTLPANIDIEMVHAAGLWPALADPGQLENAIVNLCVNARDAMPEGGKVTFETRNTWVDQDYSDRHEDVQPGQYVMLAISDTGSGIEESILPHVFDPFFTTKDKSKGTGLGLSMVYGFVKQSGGHINLYSEPSAGTTARIYLPRAGQKADARPADERSGSLKGGDESVLVVEDDRSVRQTVCQQLEGLGYNIWHAGDAETALDILTREPAIDLLFTDVMLPGEMNGRQLADRALAARSNLKILFTSGYTQNAIIHHGRLDKGVELLSKPYRQAELARRIRKVLDSETQTMESQ